MLAAHRSLAVVVCFLAVVVMSGCPSGQTGERPEGGSAPVSSSGREKGAKEAAAAVAAGKLVLKEYPPLPYPPGHQEYVQLLRQRCAVAYELPKLPPGVAEADFIQEVQAWNEVVEAEIKRKFGQDIFERLQDEARAKWKQTPAQGR